MRPHADANANAKLGAAVMRLPGKKLLTVLEALDLAPVMLPDGTIESLCPCCRAGGATFVPFDARPAAGRVQ